MTEAQLLALIEWVDSTPAVTWAGRNGVKERLLNPDKFIDQEPLPW